MRGRLLFPCYAEICRFDAAATRSTDPDGTGPRTSGFDDDFKEPVLVDKDGDGLSDFERAEMPAVVVPCQVEPIANSALQMTDAGDVSSTVIDLVFHFVALERLGLVDAVTGEAGIRKGDRLAALRDGKGNAVQSFPNPPGLFAIESRPLGFGLGGQRNLLYVKFRDRAARGF